MSRPTKTGMRALPLALALVAVCSMIVGAKNDWKEKARINKADYLYLEAKNRELADENDAAFMLLDEACRLNPADRAAGLDLASMLLLIKHPDSLTFHRAFDLVDKYYHAHPDDYYASMLYGHLNEFVGDIDATIEALEQTHRHVPTDPRVTFRLASVLTSTGDSLNIRRAISLIDTLLLNEGESLEMRMNKMQMLYMLGDTLAIKEDSRALLKKEGGRTVENLVFAGTVINFLGHPDEALDYFREACVVDSTSGLAFYSLANQYKEMGDSIGYEREIYEALTRPSLDPEMKTEILKDYILTNISTDTVADVVEAIEVPGDSVEVDLATSEMPRIEELFNLLLDQHPHEPSIHDAYASFLAYIGDYKGAAEQARYSVDIDPTQEKQWLFLVHVLQSARDYPASLQAIDDALRFFPDSPDLYTLKMISLMVTKKWEDALEAVDKTISLTDPDNFEQLSRLYTSRGDIHKQLNADQKSWDDYEKGLLYDPNNALLLNNYAYGLAEAGVNLDRAIEMAEKSLLLEPNNPNTVDTYAWALFKNKDYKRAREVFDSAIDLILSEVAKVVEEVRTDGEPEDEASEDTILEYESNLAEGYEHAGDIYFMTGDHDKAVEFWKEALKLKPDDELLKKKVTHKTYFYE